MERDTVPGDLFEKIQDPHPVVTVMLQFDPESREYRANFIHDNATQVLVTRDLQTGLWSLHGFVDGFDATSMFEMVGMFDMDGALKSFFDGDLTFGVYRDKEPEGE
jgi:hypothetical protein